MTNYMARKPHFDEMVEAVPTIYNILRTHDIPATWFARIDDKMAVDYGQADYILTQHAKLVAQMKADGHEIGWHFHSYRKQGSQWRQNADEMDVVAELQRNYKIAASHGLQSLRMGWAYHTQQTWHYIDTLGLQYDSSAMPRPVYTWEKSLRNWDGTGQAPYYPCTANYRIAGQPSSHTLQIPLTTAQILASTDTIPDMVRLVNPAYKHKDFVQAMQNIELEHIVFVIHPYEVLKLDINHAIMAFNPAAFAQNVQWLVDNNYQFNTLINYKNHITK